MIRAVGLLVVAIVAAQAAARTQGWARLFGDGFARATPTADGGALVVLSMRVGGGREPHGVRKLDAAGDVEWDGRLVQRGGPDVDGGFPVQTTSGALPEAGPG